MFNFKIVCVQSHMAAKRALKRSCESNFFRVKTSKSSGKAFESALLTFGDIFIILF